MENKLKKLEHLWEIIAPFIFGAAMVAGCILAYNAYVRGNQDLFVAWISAAGMAGGTMGAFIRIKEIKDENNIPRP